MKTKLTVEESNNLIKLGVDSNNASITDNGNHIFSLLDIQQILPNEIKIQIDKKEVIISLVIYWNKVNKVWSVYYDYSDYEIITAVELIDALYNLLIFCINNNLITINRNINDKPLIVDRQKLQNIYQYCTECTSDKDEAAITLNLLNTIFPGEDFLQKEKSHLKIEAADDIYHMFKDEFSE